MKCSFSVLLITLSSVTPAHAYKQSTHREMSKFAVTSSEVVKDTEVMRNLGLPPYSTDPKFPGSGWFPASITISQLIQNGADYEDDGMRSLHHFFNPLSSTYMYAPLSDSPNWSITAPDDSDTIKFSFQAAREYEWQAMANPLNSYDYRKRQFGQMFESLGHIVHHLQDMAQPQHVRDDQRDMDGVWRIDTL